MVAANVVRLRWKAASFLVLTALFTAFVPWEATHLPGGGMWAPGFAGMLVQLLFERRLSGLGWRLPKLRWLGLGVAFPMAYVVLAYALAWGSGAAEPIAQPLAWIREILQGHLAFPPTLPEWSLVPLFVLVLLTFGLALNCVAAFGEEIGWRGLLFPVLNELGGFRFAVIVSGVAWAVWHWHHIIGGSYSAGANTVYSLVMFSLMIVLMSIAMGWLTLRSGSVWPAVLVHAAHNLFIQGAFEPLTQRPSTGQWVTGEWGWAIPLTLTLVMGGYALLLRRKAPLPAPV